MNPQLQLKVNEWLEWDKVKEIYFFLKFVWHMIEIKLHLFCFLKIEPNY